MSGLELLSPEHRRLFIGGTWREANSGATFVVRDPADGSVITGMAASAGVVEGVARVVTSADQLHTVQQDEILVATITAPSWGPIFGRIRATVTDIGGMMSHAAIVCREYGLPAVTGTGRATTTIKSGQRIRVDGSAGRVEILED